MSEVERRYRLENGVVNDCLNKMFIRRIKVGNKSFNDAKQLQLMDDLYMFISIEASIVSKNISHRCVELVAELSLM